MAAAVGRFCKLGLLQPRNGILARQVSKLSTSTWSRGQKTIITALGTIAGGAGALIFALDHSVRAGGLQLHPPSLPWDHNGFLSTLDKASVRRGYEVYKQVCAACHSMKYVRYRELVNVIFTEEEAKAEAEQIQVEDGPNDLGEMYMRPGKLQDAFASPYPNEEAARAANNGAYPAELSLIVQARHGGEDYIFHLLTSYTDPPAGVTLDDGQYYNPYFPGGAIGMAKALYDDVIEYSDGTPATTSQLAKDVCVFLRWAGQPEHDTARLYTIKALMVGPPLLFLSWYLKRRVWSSMKSRKIVFNPPTPKPK